MKNSIYFTILSLFIAVNCLAQKQPAPTQFWVSSGFGQSHSEAFTKNPGLVAGVGFNFNQKWQLASLQWNHYWETNMEDKIQGDFNEWKLQYGWIHTKKRDQFFVKGGLAYTECNHFREVFHGDGVSIQKETTTETAWGLVGESGVNFVLNKQLGIGVSTFVNVNKNALTGGYRVNLLLGLFQDYKKKK